MAALAFAGYIARQLLVKAAVAASEVHRVVGMLVFALVPIGFLVALVLMMRSMRSSLPSAWAEAQAGEKVGALAGVASVLVPFLVVYSSLDYFVDDRTNFVDAVLADETLANPEVFTNPGSINTLERLAFDLNTWSIAAVAIVWFGRYLIGIWRSGRRKTPVRLVNAYLETVWMTLAVVLFSAAQEEIRERRFVVWADTVWQSFLAALGPLAGVGRFLGGALLAADVVILVPLAWLAVGAVVYGRSLPAGEGLTREQVRRWLRMPRGLRSDVGESFGPLMRGFGLLRRAGLGPMLLVCLVFQLVAMIPDLLWWIEKSVIGPRDLDTIWVPLSGPLGAINEAVGTIVLICLVGAAVDRVLALRSAGDGQAGVAGQVAAAVDPDGDRAGEGRRDEVGHGLVPV